MFRVAASQGALLLTGGEKGMRYAMPNARIMIHQTQSGCGGHVEDVRRQVNEAVQSRHKIDKMYAAFTGQPLEKVQQYTERDRFLSVSEVLYLKRTDFDQAKTLTLGKGFSEPLGKTFCLPALSLSYPSSSLPSLISSRFLRLRAPVKAQL
ncbi:ATP-dependent clp protease proteolytic subunit 6 chloroplastic [Fagus crenata]